MYSVNVVNKDIFYNLSTSVTNEDDLVNLFMIFYDSVSTYSLVVTGSLSFYS